MYRYLLALSLLFSSNALATFTIKDIELTQNVVVIVTQSSRDNSPCTSSHWGLDITQEQDYALYGLVLTAVAMSKPIMIEGTGMCISNDRYERVGKVSVKD
ncbi:hypothetical protein PSECIP111854_01103 [Pseudoalteromonas sp. CIP111854]|uniref:Uncharacterized protein n=1 Tax=Pseudoalteromonas holothuriae TaxID=2963714 RepID=A0A9W4VSV7_9GAMM|nr:hypothetical protein [Pseudoalteromonas sp. CIP111854]CAH9053100.1 hypothetical protein PSECIP111854_01103 [Pseudoalteromonas sp. CIP111854]